MSKHPAQVDHHYPLPFGFQGGLRKVAYRWLSGRPMNGHRYTDATGFRYGTKSTDRSGYANGYQLLPGYKRFLYARVPIMLSPAVAAVGLAEPLTLAWAGSVLSTLAIPGVVHASQVRTFRREVVEPVAASVSTVLKRGHIKGMGHTWVSIDLDFRDNEDTSIVLSLPMDWTGDDGDRKRLVQVVSDRLQLEDISPTWTLSGAKPRVTFHVPPKPPKLVEWTDAAADLSTSSETAPIIGYGARSKIETFDLKLEAPHLLVAGASNAGKSELIATIVAQFMRHGYGILCLDAKFTSHMWLRRIPGVLYAAESEELHEALLWLDAELLRRARFVSAGGDPATFTPLLAVLEEMNGGSNRLRAYWRSIKASTDPMMSPALTALQNLAAMGRELRVHILMAGQSVTAKATGGPETRENFGGRMFGQATRAQWRMLAPQIKHPPMKKGPAGRWHIVVGETVRELQVPFANIKHEEARLIEFATGGAAIPDVPTMMLTGETASHQRVPDDVVAPSPEGISLRLYAQEAGMDLRTLQRWRERRTDFPAWVAVGANNTQFYDRDHLRAFVKERSREPADQG